MLLLAYWTQFSVVPISIMKGETAGIALLTQYNERGIFIAMEELGYVTMGIALFFFSLSFDGRGKLGRAIRVLFAAPLLLNGLAFAIYTSLYGIDRSYRFEVAAITGDWLALIALGILNALHFRRCGREAISPQKK